MAKTSKGIKTTWTCDVQEPGLETLQASSIELDPIQDLTPIPAARRAMLFDAHCHLQRLPDATAPDTWVDRARAARPLPVWGCAVCGCEVADWAQVEELHRRNEKQLEVVFRVRTQMAKRLSWGAP